MLWVKGESGEVPEAEGVTYTLPSQRLSWDHVAVENGDRHKAWDKLDYQGAMDPLDIIQRRDLYFFFYKSEVCPINLPSFQTMGSLHASETLGTIHN